MLVATGDWQLEFYYGTVINVVPTEGHCRL